MGESLGFRNGKKKSQALAPPRNEVAEISDAQPESIPAFTMTSAPQDGTWILVFGIATTSAIDLEEVPPTWHRAYWDMEGADDEYINATGIWCGEDEIVILAPIAWVPIPPPPRLPAMPWKGRKPTSPLRGAHAWLAA